MRCCCSEIAAQGRFADTPFSGREQDTLHVVPQRVLRERCSGYPWAVATMKRDKSTDRLNVCMRVPGRALDPRLSVLGVRLRSALRGPDLGEAPDAKPIGYMSVCSSAGGAMHPTSVGFGPHSGSQNRD